MKLLSTVPHHAGSQAGKENAELITENLIPSRREKLISNSLGRTKISLRPLSLIFEPERKICVDSFCCTQKLSTARHLSPDLDC